MNQLELANTRGIIMIMTNKNHRMNNRDAHKKFKPRCSNLAQPAQLISQIPVIQTTHTGEFNRSMGGFMS